MNTGYYHRAYAESFENHGVIVPLKQAGGWLLERPIPGTELRDVMWCYPLLCCSRWSNLGDDLDQLGSERVAVYAVTDPFGDFSSSELQAWFPDVFKPFKEHFVVELSVPFDQRLSPHHRRNVRKASNAVKVDRCKNPSSLLDDWMALYANLIHRHRIRGITAFSRRAFRRQLRVPGLCAYRALVDKHTVGALLWYVSNSVAYYHLGAFSDVGYEKRAPYALFFEALKDLGAQGVHWANLGGAAGTHTNTTDGLARFKTGWATGTRTSYLGGRILNQSSYVLLTGRQKTNVDSYFPAYRAGEFCS